MIVAIGEIHVQYILSNVKLSYRIHMSFALWYLIELDYFDRYFRYHCFDNKFLRKEKFNKKLKMIVNKFQGI